MSDLEWLNDRRHPNLREDRLRQEVRDLNDINWLREQSREPRSAEIIEHWNDLGWLKARYKRNWDEEIAEVSIFEQGRDWDQEMDSYFEASVEFGREAKIRVQISEHPTTGPDDLGAELSMWIFVFCLETLPKSTV